MREILTIAIPTYNHHELLKEQLISLIPQITTEVILIVVDNCSNPPVRVFLEKEGVNTSSFTIIENEQNIGGDGNILKCYNITETDWIWILSDDDFIEKDALATVLEIISENQDSVFINFFAYRNRVGLSKGYMEFCRNACYWATFSISHCAFNIKKFGKYLSYYEEQVKTHQPQFLTLLKYLKENGDATCYFTNDRIFRKSHPANWPKAAFIYDSFMIYDIIPKEDLSVFKQTIGRQVIKTQLYLLVIARVYEGLSLKNYLMLFKRIIGNSPKTHLIFNKSLLFWTVCLISPKVYYFLRRITVSRDMDYNFSDFSKNLQWKY
jgi:glycosyltransferase involved in cell wall biosynthesis